MQITSFTSLAACALTLGAAAAQSAPRILQIDETPATQAVPRDSKSSEVRVLRAADGGEVFLAPATTPPMGAPEGSGAGGGLQEAAQQGFLGVMLGDGGEGAEVTSLVDGSPAEQAKLQARDRIVALDGKPIATSQELTAAIRGKRPGTVVKLSIARGDEELIQEIKLGTRGGAGVEPGAEAPRARMDAPEQFKLRTIDLDDDEDEGEQKTIRLRVGGAPPDGAHGQQGVKPRRVELRKEVRQEGGAEPQVKVWVNGEEVEPGAMGGHWIDMDGLGEFEVELEGLEDLLEHRIGRGQTFRFEGAPGNDGQFIIVHPGGKAGAGGEHGRMHVEGHAMPPMMLHGGAAPELQKRVKELEGQVERLQDQVRSLEQMVRELHGGDQARPRTNRAPAAQGNQERKRDPRTPDASAGPRPPRGTNAAETPSSGFFFDDGPGGGAGNGRAGGSETEDLRNEMRELRRAIERFERQGGGQGGGQGGNQGGNQPR